MIVHVDWHTVYSYSRPVRELHSELCVVPVERSNQRVLLGTIAVDPPTDPAVCTRSSGFPAAPRASAR